MRKMQTSSLCSQERESSAGLWDRNACRKHESTWWNCLTIHSGNPAPPPWYENHSLCTLSPCGVGFRLPICSGIKIRCAFAASCPTSQKRLAALGSPSSSFESLIQSSWITIRVWLSPCSVCKALLQSVGWKLHRRLKSMEPLDQLILTLLQLGPEFLQISPALISVTALWILCRTTSDFGLKDQQSEYFW